MERVFHNPRKVSKITSKRVGVVCPRCGNFNSLPGPIDFSDALFQCTNCHTEFTVEPEMTPNEKLFYDFLMEKKRQGYWDVDVFHYGGTRETWKGWGVDFVLYSMKKGHRGTLWIEHKHSPHFQFTNPQILRFHNSYDTNWNATRFIGIAHRSSDVNEVKFLLYWTPSFFRSLLQEPIDFFTVRNGIWYLVTDGIADCIKPHTYTSYKNRYTESDWAEIRSMPNLTIHSLSRGEFGRAYSGYNVFPPGRAFEILFEKLKYTLDNLGEDMSYNYPQCVRRELLSERFGDYIASRAEQIIYQSYRTVFVVDIRDELQADSKLSGYLKEDPKTKRFMLGKSLFKDVIRKELRKLERDDGIVRFDGNGWGIRMRNYLLFESNPISSSRFLDAVRDTYFNKLAKGDEKLWCMILPEIIEVSGVEKAVITSQRERSAKDLEINHRLMTSKLRWDGAHRARVREVCLTKKGLAYITRTGEYINSDW